VDRIHQHGRKIFATCVYAKASLKNLRVMLENGITDKNLPLDEDEFQSLNEQDEFVDAFVNNQAKFNVLFFHEGETKDLTNCELSRLSVPIIHKEGLDDELGEGAFGMVWKISIHRDYHNFVSVKQTSL
jgi:hypothetical protein